MRPPLKSCEWSTLLRRRRRPGQGNRAADFKRWNRQCQPTLAPCKLRRKIG